MDVSLSEAARLLGKSERQIRYLLKYGRVKGRKEDGRWVIRREDLPLSQGRERAQAAKQERAFEVAREVLGPQVERAEGDRRLSLRDLRATTEGVTILKSIVELAGSDHVASQAMREAMMLLAAGFHAFHDSDKAVSYVAARERASRAAMALLLDGEGRVAPAERIEQAWIPAVNGLIRRAEKSRR